MGYVFVDATVTDSNGKRLGKTRIRMDKNKLRMAAWNLRRSMKEIASGTEVEKFEIGPEAPLKITKPSPLEIKKKPNRPALWDSKTPFGL